MKVIVAGSRNCSDYKLVEEAILEGMQELDITITTLVHGAAKGVDLTAKEWAIKNGINHIAFPADWKNLKQQEAIIKENSYGKYNANAGRYRNVEMAYYADALIAIDLGTNGTNHMIKTAKSYSIPIYQYKPEGLDEDNFEYNF
jgi:hypothetical protein